MSTPDPWSDAMDKAFEAALLRLRPPVARELAGAEIWTDNLDTVRDRFPAAPDAKPWEMWKQPAFGTPVIVDPDLPPRTIELRKRDGTVFHRWQARGGVV